ncbi:MAG: hypothetical protein FWF76_02700 [Oscillospiraceae bacterium]|nr:hypothetical protein [Oscillospiraceae bacterium]
MSDTNEKKEKIYDNFDDFIANTQSEKTENFENLEYTPLHQRKIERNEDGKFAECFHKHVEDEPPKRDDYTFSGLFPANSVNFTTVKNLIFASHDIYEKIIGICMFILVGAVFNPLLHIAIAYATTDFLRVGYVLFMAGFFLYCILAVNATFPFLILVVIASGKLLFFHEGIGDVLIAVAMFATVYLMFSMKKRVDNEIVAKAMKVIEKERLESQGSPKIEEVEREIDGKSNRQK